jgi:ribonuclease P/MRP protein subunit POP5
MVRFKNRYLLVELIAIPNTSEMHQDQHDNNTPVSSPDTSSSSIASFLRNAIERDFGVYGSSVNTLALSVKYCNNVTKIAIVRCAREHLSMVHTSMILSTEWPSRVDYKSQKMISTNVKCIWRVRHVAGTIRSCQQAVINLSRFKLHETHSGGVDPATKLKLADLLLETEKQIKVLDA